MSRKLVLIFLLGTSLLALSCQAQDSAERDLRYASRSELEQMLARPAEGQNVAEIQLLLAQKYWHDASYTKDEELYKKAIAMFQLGLKNAPLSLATTTAKIQLAESLLALKRSDEGIAVLRGVAALTPEQLYEHELTPIPPGVAFNDQPAIDLQIRREKDYVLKDLNQLKQGAALTLAYEVYWRDGVAGLQRLNDEFADNPVVSAVISKHIADLTKKGVR